jgi:hypothetical protein
MNLHAERAELRERLLGWIEGGASGGEEAFEHLALALYRHQRAHNLPYRRYCESLGAPLDLSHWSQVPAVPTDVFRFLPLFCGPLAEATHTFRTSGTTNGARGEHHLRDLGLYHASARAHLGRFLLPDGLNRPALILAPSDEALPDSSLSSMLGLIARERADGRALFAWSSPKDGGPTGPDPDAAALWLREAEALGRPVQVLTTSFALWMAMDAWDAAGARFDLPPGSTLMTTGGTKGRVRDITTDEVETRAQALLGVPRGWMVHEYGMTELGSQLYDPRLARRLAGLPDWNEPCFQAPPWCRVTVHDPETLHPRPFGEVGLLRFTDLSNLDSVCAVQTSDQGALLDASPSGDTIRLLGRMPGATPRGCSLMVEEATRSAR